jgi:hypothetical protein
MKNKISHILLILMLGLGSFLITTSAQANCWYTGGFWSHGVWHQGQRVCNNNYQGCKWVGGYRDRYGRWHPRQKVCAR